MSLISKLFGGKSNTGSRSDSETKPELYGDDYRIFPEPIKEDSGYRVAARIEKDFDGEIRRHEMIRADTLGAKEDARLASLHKAQIFIDQMGERLFD